MKNVNKLKLKSSLTPSSSNNSLNEVVFLDEVTANQQDKGQQQPQPSLSSQTVHVDAADGLRHADQIFTPTCHVKQYDKGKLSIIFHVRNTIYRVADLIGIEPINNFVQLRLTNINFFSPLNKKTCRLWRRFMYKAR
jgi:hypothetical protein